MNMKEVRTLGSKPGNCAVCANLKRCVSSAFSGPEKADFCDMILRRRTMHKGEQLFSQGEDCRHIYILQTGSAKASIVAENGEEQIVFFYMSGDLLGIDGIENNTYIHTVVFLETASVCEISITKFFNFLSVNSTTSKQLVKRISYFFSNSTSTIIRLGKMTAEQKLASFIIDMWRVSTESDPKILDFNLVMSRGDVANYLGLALETVSRLLTRFQDLGLIEVQRRRIFILRLDIIKKIVRNDMKLSGINGMVA